MEETTENKLQCPICHGPVEETGKPTWAYCPTHGWVKYKSHDEPGSSDLFGKINLRAAILTKQAEEKIDDIRKKSPLFAYIVPALFITVLLAFLIGFFFWRDTSHKTLEVQRTEVAGQKEVPSQKNDQMMETQPRVSASPDEPVAVAINEKKEDKTKRAIEEKSLQAQKPRESKQVQKITQNLQNRQTTKPTKPVFTVQAGLFQNASNAKNLNKMLHEKGYDASISTSQSKKGKTVYRVHIGKFSEKKKAEDIANKIRKETGVQAFVTIK